MSETLPRSSEDGSGRFDGEIFRRSPDGMVICDEEGRYLEVNPAICALTGYSRDELLGMRVGDLTVPGERASSRAHLDELVREGRSGRVATILRKDGSKVIVETQAVALPGGKYLGIVREMARREESEQRLESALEAYATLVETCHAAVIAGGPDGTITSWNPAAERLFGYSASEAVGMPVLSLIPKRYHDQHVEALRRHAEGRVDEPFQRVVQSEGLHKDGREIPIEVSVATGRRGREPYFTVVIRDVSEQRQMWERLNNAHQLLSFHIERMPLAYIQWDDDFRVTEWNPAAERMFGYRREEALGRHAYELIVPKEVQPDVDRVWGDLLKGDESSHSVNENVRKDGERIICEWFNTPLRNARCDVHGVASMAMDITEREAAEVQLRNSQKLESLAVMAAGVAHDFNSALMVIMGNTGLLQTMPGMPERAREHIELIEDASARASELIRRLLDYTRTGRHDPRPLDLNHLVEDTLDFLRSSVGRTATLELDLGEELPLIEADSNQLVQVLLNLCVNAHQAMPDGGTITIRTRRKRLSGWEVRRCVPHDARAGEHVELLVADTGCGMDERTVSRMFDPFFTTKPQGHGLGMAAVLGILRQHHGCAAVESKPGKGTRVRVFLPIARETAGVTGREQRSSAGGEGDRRD